MAYVNVDDVKIYWRESGSGDPLLMIMGLGYSLDMWHHIEPLLAEKYRVIMFDNRGVGRSDVPEGMYSIEMMAADAIAVMDAAGVEKAYIFGVSMGGYIAQTLAYTYPERVNGLVLGASAIGGKRIVPASDEVLEVLRKRTEMEPEDSVRAMLPYIYAKNTLSDVIEEDVAIRLEYYPDQIGYWGQMQGIVEWTSVNHLDKIIAPTLILHGSEDQLVPPENSDVLLTEIPNARLEKIDNASHIFFSDQPQKTFDLITSFFSEIE